VRTLLGEKYDRSQVCGLGAAGTTLVPAHWMPVASRREYFDKARQLWRRYVPRSGQAETVPDELIRAVEKLRGAAQRNGNANWDEGYEILALPAGRLVSSASSRRR